MLPAKIRLGATLLGVVVIALGIVAVVEKHSAAELISGALLGVLGVIATLETFRQSERAFRAWALVASGMGLANLFVIEPGKHGLFFWIRTFATTLSMFWFSYLLIRWRNTNPDRNPSEEPK